MPAAMKRPAAAAPKASPKKAKKVDPLLEKKDRILESVSKASMYPEAVLNMLSTSLDLSLLVERENRHSFQQEVVEMLQQVLGKVEEAAKATVEEWQEKMKPVEAEKAEKAAGVEAADMAMQAKSETLATASAAVQEAKDARNAAKKKVSEVEKAQKSGLKEVTGLERKKAALEDCMEHFKSLTDGTAGQMKKSFQVLTKGLKQCGAEQQIVESCQSALSKIPDEREGFDKVIVESVEEVLKKALAEVQTKIDAEDTTKAELLGAVVLAANEVEALDAKLEEAKNVEDVAKAGVAEAEELVAGAKKAQQDFVASIEELEASGAEAVANLAAAIEAITAFEALEKGEEPVVEVDEAVVEIEEAVAAMEEGASA